MENSRPGSENLSSESPNDLPCNTTNGGCADSNALEESKPFDYKSYWKMGENDYPIMVTRDYKVYLDEDDLLDWQSTETLDKRLNKCPGMERTNAVYNRAASLRAMPNKRLDRELVRNFMILIGEGLARAFEGDPQSAMQMFDKASEYIIERNQEIARIWYLCATGLSTAVFGILFNVGWYFHYHDTFSPWESAINIGVASCAGAFGAFFSTLGRVSQSPLDPSAGRLLHWLEGIGRILIGFMAAIIALAAMKVGLAFTFLDGRGFAGPFLVAFVAGFSERFVRTIIKNVEMDPGAGSGIK